MGAGAAGYNWVEAPAVLSSEVGLGFGLADGNFPYPDSVSDGVHPVAVVAGVCRPVADRVRREEPLSSRRLREGRKGEEERAGREGRHDDLGQNRDWIG